MQSGLDRPDRQAECLSGFGDRQPEVVVQDDDGPVPRIEAGEGGVETEFAGYHPVVGEPPMRVRTTANPLNRAEYLMHLARRVASVR